MSATPNRASNPAGKPRRKDVTLDLSTARQMLPLVRSIMSDIVATRQAVAALAPEGERLDRHRRDLSWAERQRRYHVHEELKTAESRLTGAVGELEGLGLTLSDLNLGAVDFPTRINGRPAAFSWQYGEDAVGHWHYTGEELRRPIPNDWEPGTPLRHRSEP